MRKALVGAAVIGLLGLAACTPVKSGPAPNQRDVLIVGDSIAGGLGCFVFGEGGQPGGPVAIPPCTGQPGISAANGWLGACTISGGSLQLWNRTALDTPNCWNYGEIWKPLVDAYNPKLVILWTSGWEIVNRWSSFPDGALLCDRANISTCTVPADRQWGNPLAPDALANAKAAYRSNLHNAIDILRSNGAKVLVLNSPYINPLLPAPPSVFFLPELLPSVPNPLEAVWYEPYLLPVDPIPHPLTPFGPSKLKVENFNAEVSAAVAAYGDPANVQMFDIWRYLSPKLTPIDLPVLDSRGYSQLVCAYPNSEQSILTCPTSLVNARYGADGGHITPDGYYRIVEPYLMPKVREMLGI